MGSVQVTDGFGNPIPVTLEDKLVVFDEVDFEKEKEKFLLIQPDVAFFDKDETPILLIEIVATHKVDPEKIVKIKRLGIDTVQVKVPKDSPQEIENCFYKK